MVVVIKLIDSVCVVSQDLITAVRGDHLVALDLQQQAFFRSQSSSELHFSDADGLEYLNDVNLISEASTSILVAFQLLISFSSLLHVLAFACAGQEGLQRTSHRLQNVNYDLLVAHVSLESGAVGEHVVY